MIRVFLELNRTLRFKFDQGLIEIKLRLSRTQHILFAKAEQSLISGDLSHPKPSLAVKRIAISTLLKYEPEYHYFRDLCSESKVRICLLTTNWHDLISD